MLVGFAPGILIAVLLYLDKTDPTKHHQHKNSNHTEKTVRTATRTSSQNKNTAVRNSSVRRTKKSVEGDADKIKYTFYVKLLDDEVIVGDKQIKREARKYRQQLQREQRAERRRLRLEKSKLRKARLAKKKKQAALARKSKAKKASQQKNKKRNNKTVTARNKKKQPKNSKKSANHKATSKKKTSPFPDYILIQAGSFRKKKQANQHRAKLALYGVSSAISSATIKGELWYRVRVGPFSSYKDMKSKLAKLRKKKIKVMPIRVGKK